MDKVAVLIVEDNQEESDALIRVLEDHGLAVAGVARSQQEALQLLFAVQVDIIVIDVFLNGVPEGLSFAEAVNTVPGAARPFVFLTSSSDRAIFDRARLTRPFSFLLKPFNELEVIYSLEMALEKFYAQPEGLQGDEQDTVVTADYLFIKKQDTLKKVETGSIVYVSVEERYSMIFTAAGKYVVLMSLSKLAGLLDPKRFVRTHRNYIVNVDTIEEIHTSDNLLLLTGRHLIPFSDTYRDFLGRFRLLK